MPKTIHRPEYAALCELVREMRLAAGRTQVELSQALGRPQSYVSDIERGTRRVDLIELRDLCEALGGELVELVTRFEALAGRRRTRRR
jgi:transcriptional regulator with XRE-family HTH domain